MKQYKTLNGLLNYAEKKELNVEKIKSYRADESSYQFNGFTYLGSADIYLAQDDFGTTFAYFKGRG